MRKFFALVVASVALFIAQTSYAASSLFSWNATNTTDLTAWIGQMWTDFSTPIILVVGVSLGFVIIRKLVGMVKAGAR